MMGLANDVAYEAFGTLLFPAHRTRSHRALPRRGDRGRRVQACMAALPAL